jgi:hypothetical protein
MNIVQHHEFSSLLQDKATILLYLCKRPFGRSAATDIALGHKEAVADALDKLVRPALVYNVLVPPPPAVHAPSFLSTGQARHTECAC